MGRPKLPAPARGRPGPADREGRREAAGPHAVAESDTLSARKSLSNLLEAAMAPDPDRVLIFDTTLRDGEQSPGCSMTQLEKLRVARALADLGVDVIEAGVSAASRGDWGSVPARGPEGQGPIITPPPRPTPEDNEPASKAPSPPPRPAPD